MDLYGGSCGSNSEAKLKDALRFIISTRQIETFQMKATNDIIQMIQKGRYAAIYYCENLKFVFLYLLV